jgi:2-oxoglutarate dehydrogenase complex dehydrogenase (E1) component-like enzyme
MSGLDEYDELRAKFNESFRKITQKEVDALTPGQRKIYDEIKSNKNIAAVPKGKSQNTLLNSNIRLREFDSETYKNVPRSPMDTSKSRERKRRKAEDKSLAYKTYNTSAGMKLPQSKPTSARPEHRGRLAEGSADKS